ncbi:MAG: bifunctional folylpolyglutamate synthase/dihydrofolate synthase [Altererythrobacter sp.]|nr:bifunctional folylpolyglutamate synthase/dihydrofolate synthase [Altererythrobacter sp.]
MRDMGRSDDPRVQAQLDRLGTLSIQRDTLGLDAIRELMRRLGDPHKQLPPTFHVAGTNGKGSTCAFLRTMLEAEGYRVHVTTSPHLVRYNERFRVAGKLIDDARLAELLEQVFDAAEGLDCSFFEISIAAAFVEFARVPADACVVEVGLGGRLDATNVLEPDVLAACGIAALGIDHEKFLLAPEEGVPSEPMARIAFEKAGIAKQGVPLVTVAQPEIEMKSILASAERAGTTVSIAQPIAETPASLPGAHQAVNAGLAITMLRTQDKLTISEAAISQGLRNSNWPARLHRLKDGPLTQGREVWLDGGHNASAGAMLGAHFAGHKLHLVIGMIEGKEPSALIGPLAGSLEKITVVPVPNFPCHPPEAFGETVTSAPNVCEAIIETSDDGLPVLIAGSLYLAGEVLRLNDEIPD